MTKSNEYLNYILDLLTPLGDVTARSMFGGYGIYNNKVIFAIIGDDTLYFKVTDENIGDYEDVGSSPFTYTKKGKDMQMSYWIVPEDVLEDQDMLLDWAEKAYIASCNIKR